MKCILRVVVAALWALPGPILVSVILAVTLGPRGYYPGNGHSMHARTAVENVLIYEQWFYLQAPLAILYGIARAWMGPTNVTIGTFLGVLVWFAVGGALLLLGALGGDQFYFGGPSLCGGPPRTPQEIELAILAHFVAHVVGGAIAGFHVEYFLLHWGRVRGGNGGQPFTE